MSLIETVKKLETAEYAFNDQNLQLAQVQTENDLLNRAHNDQLELNVEQQLRLEKVQQVTQELEETVKDISLDNEKLVLQLNHVQKKLGKTLLQKQNWEQQTKRSKMSTRK